MHCLLLDNHDSFTYNLAELLRQVGGVPFEVISSSAFEPTSAGRYTHILFSPGPGLPEEQPAMSGILRQIELLHKQQHPFPTVLGVCLGMQAMAMYFGGRLYNLPAVVHGQPRPLRLLKPDHPLFAGIPGGSKAGLYHSWAVDRHTLPACFDLLAVDDREIVMAISHKVLPLWGVQFHPESVMTPWGGTMMGNWIRHLTSDT